MRIRTQAILSRSEGPWNEDQASVTKQAAWVFDGSSGLTESEIERGGSDSRWFVQAWDRYLRDHLRDDAKGLHRILKDGIDHIRDRYIQTTEHKSLDKLTTPSSSVVVVRFHTHTFEYFVLGDCTLIIDSGKGKVETFSDDRVHALDMTVIQKMHELIETEHFSLERARNRLLPLLRQNRLLKNTEQGYWILEFDKRAIDHGVYEVRELDAPVDLLLMSDGFAQLWSTFGYAESPEDLLKLASADGLDHLYGKLRELSYEDKDCLRFPRLKTIDDASAVLLHVDLDEPSIAEDHPMAL